MGGIFAKSDFRFPGISRKDACMTRMPFVSALVFFLSAVPTWPCGFHNYVPQPTMVEHMLSSSSIALARPSAASAFNFEVVEVLRGPLPDERIPFLVDTATRLKLKTHSGSVLFTYDDVTQSWQRLALIDDEMRPLVDEILTHLPEWRLGGDAHRAQMFAQLLDHPKPEIRHLALRELDRLDYSILRGLLLFMDTQSVLTEVNDPWQRTLAPIRVLLLGLSRDQGVAQALVQGIDNNRISSGPLLGAYATALIELQGVDAVQMIATHYLVNADHSGAARELLIEALAIHSSYGAPEVVAAIEQALADAIANNPQLAIPVARQFMARYDWSQHHAISQALVPLTSVGTDEDRAMVEHYVLVSAGEGGVIRDH